MSNAESDGAEDKAAFELEYSSFTGHANRVRLGHFLPIKSVDSRRAILASSLKMVELEVSSFCNRTCSFCPNSFIDRHTHKHDMDSRVYESIITQLADLDYDGILAFARYSEAFADKTIIDKIAYARKRLPKAFIRVVTNGDYLNEAYVALMREVKLDNVIVSVYLMNGQEFTKEHVERCIEKIERKIGQTLTWTHPYDGGLAEKAGGKNPHFILSAQNFKVRGYDRGGLIPEKFINRVSPCFKPFTDIYVDYNGKVVPCCNIRSDAEAHQDYILGDLNEQTLLDVFFSEKAVAWRKELFHFSDKLPPPATPAP